MVAVGVALLPPQATASTATGIRIAASHDRRLLKGAIK
ncbi:hypothetical protein MMMB2_2296 [Mycobacterium marinum MB2]|nr:hypothetical protein MMMB2_2296 [Mycobacterium marinum MB2]